MNPNLAHSGLATGGLLCPLSGVKQTCRLGLGMFTIDPKRKFGPMAFVSAFEGRTDARRERSGFPTLPIVTLTQAVEDLVQVEEECSATPFELRKACL
jgi:hypothetical protein